MSPEWAGIVLSAVGLVTGIAGWWLQPLIASRMAGSKERRNSAPPPPATPSISTAPPSPSPPAPGVGNRTDQLRQLQKKVATAAVIVPVVTLAYGVFGLRVGVASLGVLPAAVAALLFAAAMVPLVVAIGTGSRRAIRSTETICGIVDYVFLGATIVFVYFTAVGLLHAVGLDWPEAEFDNPGLAVLLGGVLSALSGVAWYVTREIPVLAGFLRRQPPQG